MLCGLASLAFDIFPIPAQGIEFMPAIIAGQASALISSELILTRLGLTAQPGRRWTSNLLSAATRALVYFIGWLLLADSAFDDALVLHVSPA